LCVAIASVVQDEEVVEWSEASTLISIIMVLKKKIKNDLLPRKKDFASLTKNIGMHTSTLEYVSIANISTTPSSP
jgi:hypothetical protein